VIIEDEIIHIRNLISLNQIRFNNNFYIELNVQSDFSTYRIIPLVLLTLAENVLKYGDLTSPDRPAVIAIGIADGMMYCSTINKKAIGINVPKGNGIGISNSLKRLENSYGESFKLVLKESQSNYQVDLFINIDCLC